MPPINHISCFKANANGSSPSPIALGAEAENTAIMPNITMNTTTTTSILSGGVSVYVVVWVVL